jgi:putative sterol carrier protein
VDRSTLLAGAAVRVPAAIGRARGKPEEVQAMTDATANFFDELGRRGHEALLEKVTGTVRFDLVQGDRIDHYFVSIKKGDVAVAGEGAEADSVFRTERSLFDDIASGRENAMAALLRGTLGFQGDPQLLLLFQRLFPGPSSSRDLGDAARSERRRP